MKCLACDCLLTDFEATRKYAGTSTFVDMCNRCLAPNEDYVERADLSAEQFDDTEAPEDYDVS